VWQVASVGHKKNAYTALVATSEKIKPLGKLSLGGRIIIN
jgi:hypothetical protein